MFFCQILASPIMAIIEKSSTESIKTVEETYDNYIIVFRESVDYIKAQMHYLWVDSLHLKLFQGYGQKILGTSNENIKTHQWLNHEYEISNRLRGYSGRFPDEIIELIRKHDDVAFVEKDQIVHTMMIQKNAEWGLARVSHKDMLNFSTFSEYDFDSSSGQGVTVYIIDTGINIEHSDFCGRAKWGITIPQNTLDVDDNGHGTHVAGIVAGSKYGVAKNAIVVAVKVLKGDGSGLLSDVIKGIEWAVGMYLKDIEALTNNTSFKGSVANLSLGGAKSLHFTVAAGNDNDDACNYSPASSENAITVGAVTILDNKAQFSNYGKCVDIFAPGQNIISTWIGSSLATMSLSGTSMASPHVCGLVAYFLSLVFKDSKYDVFFTSDMLKKMIYDLGNKDVLHNIPQSTKNLLAYNVD
ncbi:unnamed protein product [Pneumocystis jirovecii]|uniref:Peptidase S8/S53 domain-containing protein n=1 Tax=Pneumocystis jirovecii TaxID=42068 RepID=L0PD75_PNEJI|nr:unnamed protein product [Pneumocystis jirovecii]